MHKSFFAQNVMMGINPIVTYGYIYNWYVGNSPMIAPIGWHVPTLDEWIVLRTACQEIIVGIGSGRSLKSKGNLTDGTGLWIKSNQYGNDEFGMKIEPAGIRNNNGSYGGRNSDADFWCNDDYNVINGKYVNFNYNSPIMYTNSDYYLKNYGFSLRIVKDNSTWNVGDTVTDVDGNVYNTVKIGNQVWINRNYIATKFRDGTVIPFIYDRALWSATTTPAMCAYV